MRRESVRDFWTWFHETAPRLAELYEAKRFQQLSEEVNVHLDAISKELPWEIGPGENRKYSFTLSPEGNQRLSTLIHKVLREAPELDDWEFCSSRRPRTPPQVIRLPEREVVFRTEHWRFVPEVDAAVGRAHVTILGPGLALAGRDAALKAVSIFLDQFLGEDTVERCIGRLEIAEPRPDENSYPISDLPAYIARVRGVNKRG